MTVPGNLSSPLLATAAGAAAAYQIDRSLRFNPGDSAYLNRTPSSAGNRQSWTWSGWVKRSSLSGSARQVLFGGYGASTQTDEFQFGFGGQYETQDTIYWTQSSSSAATSSVYRDLSAWYHIVVSYDGSNIKIYVNGGLILTSAKTGDLGINGAWSHAVGADPNTNARLFNGYLAEVHFIDGQALAASDFGEYDDNNVWQPKEYSGTYGTNGFRLTFSDNSSNSALGNDSSGNSNTFTVNNLVVNVEGAETSAISSISGNTLTFTDSTNLNKFNAGDIIQEVSDAPRSGYTSQVPTNPENAVDGDINTHTIFSSNSGSSADWYEWTLPYARSYTTLQIVMSGSAASGNDVYIGASNGTQSQATNQFEGSLSSTATAYTLTNMPNPVKSFSLFLAGGNYSPTFKLHGLIIDGSYVKTVTAASVSVANNQIVSEAGGDWATGRTAVKPAIEGDDMIDTPTNYTADSGNNGGNYATLNSLAKGTNVTLSNGNLDYTAPSGSFGSALSTIGVSSGKWYAEYVWTSGSSNSHVGIAKGDINLNTWLGNNAGAYTFYPGGVKYNNGSSSSYGASYGNNDVIGVAFDADAGTLVFYINGTSQGTAFTGLTSGPYFFGVGMGQDGQTATFNFGQRPFAYTPPTNHLSLCTQNLPDPTIPDGSTAFDVITATGTGAERTFTMPGGFGPDLVWSKSRSNAYNHGLFDTVRGGTKRLRSNSTDAEDTSAQQVKSFTSDGFVQGTDVPNTNGETGVYWAWDAGTSTASNTDGSITTNVRASQTNGFSIATYTGNGSANQTLGHALGAAPAFVLIKDRSSSQNWAVLHTSAGTLGTLDGGTNYKLLELNASAAARDASYNTIWHPTNTTVKIGEGASSAHWTNKSGDDYLMLSWTPIEGFSAFGSYEGTGSPVFAYTGFRPAWVLYKNADAAAGWQIYDSTRDPFNQCDARLQANSNGAEDTEAAIDIVSNGFVQRATHVRSNASGNTYIYAAFSDKAFSLNGGLAR